MASRGPSVTLAPSALAAGAHGVRSRSRLRHTVHTGTEIPSPSLKFITDFDPFFLINAMFTDFGKLKFRKSANFNDAAVIVRQSLNVTQSTDK